MLVGTRSFRKLLTLFLILVLILGSLAIIVLVYNMSHAYVSPLKSPTNTLDMPPAGRVG